VLDPQGPRFRPTISAEPLGPHDAAAVAAK